MEDQVPYKVFVYWNKGGKPEVRRFGIEKTVVTSFHYLNAKLQDVYPGLKGKTFSVTWKDEDGDDVVVSSDEEMMTALQVLKADIVKLNIYVQEDEDNDDDLFKQSEMFKDDDQDKDEEVDIVFTATRPSRDRKGAPAAHYGVLCDCCDKPVVGFRYKCTTCTDYDLCSRCEAAGKHPEHCMVRVPTPTMPRTVIKAAIKRSRNFLKTVAGTVNEDGKFEHFKKCKREKSGDRRHRGHHSQHRSSEHSRRPRASWFDTFTTYMNEFANLAGDDDMSTNKPKPKAQTQSQTNTSDESKQQQDTQNQTEANPEFESPFSVPRKDFDKIKGFLEKHLPAHHSEAVLSSIASFLPGNSTQSATSHASASSQSQPTDVEMEEDKKSMNGDKNTTNGDKKAKNGEITTMIGDRKITVSNNDSDNISTTSFSISYNDGRDASAGGWTLIDDEQPEMFSAPADNTVIGFNLPEEFQERVNISGGLYPPLNTSTAEPAPSAPQAPEPAPASAARNAEQAQKPEVVVPKVEPVASSQPQSQPRQRHPKAHIDAAIQQMLAMGFTNDGGWLTQLLENKDGNIAAVLDLLTPVAPPKK